jgi:hypothetical protein
MAPSVENDRYLRTVWPVYLLQAKDSWAQQTQPRPIITPPKRKRGTGQSQEWLRGPLDGLVEAVSRFMKNRHQLELAHVFPYVPCPHTTTDVDCRE